MRLRASHRSSELRSLRRRVRWGAVAGSVVASFAVVSVSLAGLSSLATGGPQTIATKRIFPGPRSLSAQTFADASSGAESDQSNDYSYADGNLVRTSTAIASGTNRYLEFTLNSSRPGGLPVSSPLFNFRLASVGGAGNACFWFDVRSGASVIGTHGSYASPVGCSANTTQTTFSTAITEVNSTDRANGLVIRAYVWETGGTTRRIDVDMATVSGSTPYGAFTQYEIQAVDDTSGTPATTLWPLETVDGTTYTATNNSPSANPSTTRYLKDTLAPFVPTGSVVTGVSLTNVWRASAAVTNGGTLCYYVEVFNGATSLATHGSGTTPVACTASNTVFTTNTISLPEVNDVTKANNLVLRFYYWMEPLCGGGGNPNCVKSVTDRALVTYSYYLD